MEIEKILNHIFNYKFPGHKQLVMLAKERYGFGGDDGSYGITYPSDLDEFSEVEGNLIPEGKVEIYCKAFDVESFLIGEAEYISALKKYLLCNNQMELARKLDDI